MSDYFAKWYEANKAKLAEKRRARYAENAEYRERVLEQSRSYKARAKTGDVKHSSYELLEVNGSEQKCWRLGELCRRINRSRACVRYWVEHEYLPNSPLRDEEGLELYTEGMMLVIKMALQKQGRMSKSAGEQMRADVLEGWARLKIS